MTGSVVSATLCYNIILCLYYIILYYNLNFLPHNFLTLFASPLAGSDQGTPVARFLDENSALESLKEFDTEDNKWKASIKFVISGFESDQPSTVDLVDFLEANEQHQQHLRQFHNFPTKTRFRFPQNKYRGLQDIGKLICDIKAAAKGCGTLLTVRNSNQKSSSTRKAFVLFGCEQSRVYESKSGYEKTFSEGKVVADGVTSLRQSHEDIKKFSYT